MSKESSRCSHQCSLGYYWQIASPKHAKPTATSSFLPGRRKDFIFCWLSDTELQVNGKFSATQWRKNTQAEDSLMSKARKQARRGGDDIRNSLIKDLHCIGLKFMSSDLSRSRKQLSGCKDRIEQGLPTQMMIDYFRGTTEYSDLRPQGAEYAI